MKPEELKNIVTMLRELGLSYEETLDIIRGVAKDSHLAGRLRARAHIMLVESP